MKTLYAIAHFIELHGFKATVNIDHVVFCIPFTSPDGDGYTVEVVRTIRETRAALGY